MNSPDRGIRIEVGPFEIDLPQTLGYYGGIGTAVALGMLEPPLAVFIAAIPMIKLLADPAAPPPIRFVGQLLKGAAKPVGSDGEGTIQLADSAHTRAVAAPAPAAGTS